MADEPKQQQGKGGAKGGQGRPGKTRVGPAAASSGRATPSPKKPPKKAPPRHVWDRGIFWFGVIVVVALGAFGMSYALERDPYEVDLAGADLTAFCAQVDVIRTTQPGNFDLSVDTAAATFENQRTQLEALAAVAPPAVRDDVQATADKAGALAEKAREVAARKASDPEYAPTALVDLVSEFDRLGAENRKADGRIAYATRVGCNIDLEAPAPPGTTELPLPPGVAPTDVVGDPSPDDQATVPGGVVTSVPTDDGAPIVPTDDGAPIVPDPSVPAASASTSTIPS